MSDYWFFLSHARRDALGEEYVPRFFEDLARRVGQLAAVPTNVPNAQIGFADFGGLEPGQRWPSELSEALQSSRTLVCLYSPAYFQSDYCGRELRVFLDRVASQPHGAPPSIIPVLWEGADRLPDLPPDVASIHYETDAYGSEYERGGVHWMISLAANRDGYMTAVDRLATRIVEAARTASLPRLPSLPPLDHVGSAFGHSRGPASEPNTVFGPGTGVFVYVAAKDTEAMSMRSTTGAYGPTGGRDWRPWFPEVQRAVGVISQGVASLENLFYETVQVGTDLIDRLRQAEEANAIVVIVVDPWTVQLDSYRLLMEAFDKSSFVNCGLLVTWNDLDQETSTARAGLLARLRHVFSRTFILNAGNVRDSICSAEELQQSLIAEIGDIRRRIFQRAAVLRDVDASMALPAIAGPGG